MSVDLNKHKDELLGAWKEVVDDKNATNWAVFGYEKQSNVLTVVGTGDGGLDEIAEELNVSKIMYAFCRVSDPNTGLTKFVFINWQGEGVQLSRKGRCANHVRDIANFFKPHITVNARNEDDIEPAIITEKVAKSTSTFNFKERSETNDNVTPVGSVYERIQPAKEINAREREKFWMKEKEEEKRRVEEERRKSLAEKDKLERERRDREVSEAVERESKVKERSQSISETREAERNAQNSARNVEFEKMQWEKRLQEDVKDEEDRRRRSESLRKERSQEAQRMISTRTINARAIFERNTCAGQMNSVVRSNSNSSNESVPSSTTNTTMVSGHPGPNIGVSTVTPTPSNLLPSALVKVSPAYNTEVSREVRPPAQQDNLRMEKSDMSISLSSKDEEEDLDQGSDVPSPAPPERPLPGSAETSIRNNFQESDFSYARNLLKEGLPPRQDSEAEDEEQNWDEPTLEDGPEVKDALTEMLSGGSSNIQASQGGPSPRITSNQVSRDNEGLRAKALYDYQAADETEISFDPDDLITHIEQIDEGWWQGMGPNGAYGLFPANYVELID